LKGNFFSQLLEAGAAESSGSTPSCHLGNDTPPEQSSTVNVQRKIFLPSSDMWHANNEFASAAFSKLPENGSFWFSVLTLHLHVIFVLLKFLLKFLCVIEHSRQLHRATSNILCKLNKVIHTVDDLHLKHRQLAESYQKERDSSAWNRAEQKHLEGILYSFC
jgi:E3 ubiquitin-protein ligase BRE1